MCERPYLCDEEKCMVLELERACYNEMERESMEYFYAAEKELQRQRERIRQLENVGLSNILYSERFKEGSKFFFGREPGQGAHR